jgi:metallo-beta-lactamase class B
MMLAPVASLAAQQPRNWTDTITPFQVIGNIHYVGTAGIAAWLITTPSGYILLDVGVPEAEPQVARNIAALGFRVSDVKILINSHAHYDHSGGIAAFKRRSGAELWMSAGDTAAMQRGVYIGLESDTSFNFPGARVDRIVHDSTRITLGGVTLTALLTPGHSGGATTWLMEVDDKGVKRSVVFFGGATVAANRLAPTEQYPGIVADYRRTFARMRHVRAEVFLSPHAEQYDLLAKRSRLQSQKVNPFVDPEELGRAMRALESAFERSLAEQQARGAGRRR